MQDVKDHQALRHRYSESLCKSRPRSFEPDQEPDQGVSSNIDLPCWFLKVGEQPYSF